jgi:hypothetical protein
MPVVYNEQTKQFERDGEVIETAAILLLIDKLLGATKREAKRISAKLDAGTITLEQWRESMATLLRNAHIVAASVGRGGVDRMTSADWQKVNKKVQWQYGYLALFAKAIAAGVVVNIGARAAKYASAVFVSYSSAFRESQIESKTDKMLCRLVTNSKEGCSECADDEAAGWMPVDEMSEIGSRICGDYCLCQIEFEDEI